MQHEAGPDGVARSPEQQRLINEQLALAFKGAAGEAALAYLRSISIERVCGPHAGDAELRHLEGMRYIVGIISQRVAAHHKEQKHAGTPDTPRKSPFAAAPASRRKRERTLPG
jgi:hypothetical protein